MKKIGSAAFIIFILLLTAACSNEEQVQQGVQAESEQEETAETSLPVKAGDLAEEEGKGRDEEPKQQEQPDSVNKEEAYAIYDEAVSSIARIFYDSGMEYSWHNTTNPADFAILKPGLEPYATENFLEEELRSLAKEAYCDCGQIFFPYLHEEVRFKYAQDGNVLQVEGLKPANEKDNFGEMWEIELMKENGDWKINAWEVQLLFDEDIQLTREEVEQLLLTPGGEVPPFITAYDSADAGGTAYLFGEGEWLVAISSTDSRYVTDYPENIERSNQSDPDRQARPEDESVVYETYTNSRYGFTVEYPASFTMGEPPTNNDGRSFSDGVMNFSAYAHFINLIEENETIKTYFNRELEDINVPVAYERLADDWFVISYTENGDIYYIKAIVGKDIISFLRISYPEAKKDIYDPIVEHIANSFEGGITELAY